MSKISPIKASEFDWYSASRLISKSSSFGTGRCLVLISMNNRDSSLGVRLLYMTTGTRNAVFASENPYTRCWPSKTKKALGTSTNSRGEIDEGGEDPVTVPN